MYSCSEAPKATCHSFTLTSIKGDKSYVTCLTMYEALGEAAGAAQEKHTQYTIGPSLVVPVCYCLMSRVVCTEFSRAWLLRYVRAAKAEQPLMAQRVLKCKITNKTHTTQLSFIDVISTQTSSERSSQKAGRSCLASTSPIPWTSILLK